MQNINVRKEDHLIGRTIEMPSYKRQTGQIGTLVRDLYGLAGEEIGIMGWRRMNGSYLAATIEAMRRSPPQSAKNSILWILIN
jgi:hypothetical protein